MNPSQFFSIYRERLAQFELELSTGVYKPQYMDHTEVGWMFQFSVWCKINGYPYLNAEMALKPIKGY